MTDALRFTAQVIKIQTMVDGAIRLTFDLSETQIEVAKLLMECKSRGGLLEIAAVPIDQVITVKQKENNAIQTRSKWQS